MSALEKLNFFLSTYGRLFLALFNVRLWPPFLLYVLVGLLAVWGINSMFSPLLASWLIPLLIWCTNVGITHYPQHLAYMPTAFQWINLATSLFIESLLTGAATLMFLAYYRGEKPSFGVAVKSAWKEYGKIFLIWLVTEVAVILLFRLIPGLFREYVAGSPRREYALSLGLALLSSLLIALFIYAIPYLMIRKRKLGSCFSGTFNLFFRNFFMTYFFVAIPQFIITVLLILPLQSTDTLVRKFNPGLILILMVALVFVSAVSSFFTTGSIVRYFLEVSEE